MATVAIPSAHSHQVVQPPRLVQPRAALTHYRLRITGQQCHDQDLESVCLTRNVLASRTKAPDLPAGTVHLRLLEGRVRVDGNETGTKMIDDEVETRNIGIGRMIMREIGRGAIGRGTRTIGIGRAGMTTGNGTGIEAAGTTTTIGIRETQVVIVTGKGIGRGTIVIEGPG
jgi:hypothetical protein